MTKPNDIAKELQKQLQMYAEGVQEKVDVAKGEVADGLVRDLQRDSPERRPKYKDGWKIKKQKDALVVHNKQYQLTHLLEHGHLLRNGKRFNGTVHIRPNEEKAVKEYLKKIERAIEQ